MKQFIIFFAISISLYSQVPTNGLIAYYPFSGNAIDQSGNGRNGNISGATLTTDRFGNANSAYYFNGNNQQITVANFPVSTNSITLSFWFNTLDTTKNQRMVTHNWTTGSFTSHLSPRTANKVDIGTSTKNDNNGGELPLWGNSIQQNQWYHFLMTYDNSTLKLFLNNQLISSVNRVNALQAITTSLNIGGNAYFFYGKIDDIRIYNRALTVSEINAIYNESPCNYIIYDTITVKDTVKITVRDTIKTTIRDTVTYTFKDTVKVTIRDTVRLAVTDTLLINIKTSDVPVEIKTTVKIYPNPATDKIFVDVGDLQQISGYVFKITNSIGQQVLSKIITQQQFDVDISMIGAKGAYSILIYDKNNYLIAQRKLIIY